MRTLSLSAAAVLLTLGSVLSAQVFTRNNLFFEPATIRYTSRGNVGKNSGELMQGFYSEYWRGIGDNGTTGKVAAFIARNFQDQNKKTQETFTWVIRKFDTTKTPKQPDMTTAGVIGKSGALKTPPSATTGLVSYRVTSALATPISIPVDKDFTVGVQIGKANWTADGLSCWIGANLGGGDDNRAASTALDMAWQYIITTAGNTLSHPSGKRIWRMGVQVKNDVLKVGNVFGGKNNYGSGGIFPDLAASPAQGLAFRVTAGNKVGEIALVMGSTKLLPVGAPLFPGTRLFLNLAGSFFFAPRIVIQGMAEFVAVPALPKTLKGVVYWQAALINTRTFKIAMTNATASSF